MLTSTLEVRTHLAAEPRSAKEARSFTEATLGAWGCDALVDVSLLLVSELVTNAVLHAGSHLELVVRLLRDRVRFEVHDGSPRSPELRPAPTEATTGRGLTLVERLASCWGTDLSPDGKAVWFELPLAGRSAG